MDQVLFPAVDEAESQILSELPLLDSASRFSVYKLINSIGSPVVSAGWVKTINDKVDPNLLRWSVERSQLILPESGYLGLRNLSNTCYMNSLLTQMYMNPEFRDLMVNQDWDESTQPLLFETQQLFCRMQNSLGPWGDATAFGRQIRTYTGEQINFNEQMDVEEFFNVHCCGMTACCPRRDAPFASGKSVSQIYRGMEEKSDPQHKGTRTGLVRRPAASQRQRR